MSVQPLLDAAGRRRSPATMPGFRAGIAPRNKGQSYPADPPTVDEIVAVMRQAGHGRHSHRLSSEEIISTVHARRAPMMHASAGLAL